MDYPSGFTSEEKYFNFYPPLLTREEELAYAQDIERTRREFTEAVLSTPLGIRRAVAILHDVHQGNRSFSRYIRFSETEPAYAEESDQHVSLSESQIRKRLPSTLHQLDALIAENKIDQATHLALALPLQIHKVHRPILKELRKKVNEMDMQKKGKTHYAQTHLLEPTSTLAHTHLASIEMAYDELNNARCNLANGNHPLVKNIADQYAGHGISVADLCGEGEIGLLCAVDKFEYRRGVKFATYATWWVQKTIRRALENYAHTIHIPVHNGELVNAVRSHLPEFNETYGRNPRNTDADIWRLKALSNISEENIREYFRILNLRNTRHFDDLIRRNKSSKDTQEKSFTLGSILAGTHTNDALTPDDIRTIREGVMRVMQTIHITTRLPFKIRHGLALKEDPPDKRRWQQHTRQQERSLIRAIIKHRNGMNLNKHETKLLLEYSALRDRTDLTDLPISELGSTPKLDTTDETYLGSLLVSRRIKQDVKRKKLAIAPTHFFEGSTYTLDQVAQIFGVVRERIRQLETKVELQLQDYYRAPMLKPYIESVLS